MKHIKTLIIAILCAVAGTANTAKAWSGSGSTADDPIVISTLEDWNTTLYENAKTNGYGNGLFFSLEADLDGIKGLRCFQGTLDGNGHTLTLAEESERFIALAERANIHDLHLSGNFCGLYIFSFVTNATLSGCYFECGISGPGTTLGIVANTQFGAGTVTNCIFALNDDAPGFVRSGDATSVVTAYPLTLTGGVTAVRTGGTGILGTLATVYADGFKLKGTEYYQAGATVTIDPNIPTGNVFFGYTGNVTPNASNQFTMPASAASLTSHYDTQAHIDNWQASITVDGYSEATAYVITTTQGLDLLATEVNAGNKYQERYFRLGSDIAYSYTSNDDNNFTRIGYVNGNKSRPFCGTFDGGGHTVSGIRINQSTVEYQGLFGRVGGGGTVKNVRLDDTRIVGAGYTGGIVGSLEYGTASGCTVGSDVNIEVQNNNNRISYKSIGGIVGYLYHGTVSGCTSSVNITVIFYNDYAQNYGGIVGNHNYGTIENCVAAGVILPLVKGCGAIVGYRQGGPVSNNKYHSSLYNGYAYNIGIGYISGSTTNYGDATDKAELDNTQLWLFDNRDNRDILYACADPTNYVANSGIIDFGSNKARTITLKGRTLYKDGKWNTLCLPFSLTAQQVTDFLAPDGLMTLKSSSFDAETGQLTLNFENATSIGAATPFIIKWNRAANYVDDNAHNLYEPTFTQVSIPADYTNADRIDAGLNNAKKQTAYVDFVGTLYPVTLTSGDRSVLFLGNNNTLYYPGANMDINSFRAYFQLHDIGSSIKEFNLNFEDEDATSIQNSKFKIQNEDDAWYDLSGRKMVNGQMVNGKWSLPRGIYIHNGKKVIVE